MAFILWSFWFSFLLSWKFRSEDLKSSSVSDARSIFRRSKLIFCRRACGVHHPGVRALRQCDGQCAERLLRRTMNRRFMPTALLLLFLLTQLYAKIVLGRKNVLLKTMTLRCSVFREKGHSKMELPKWLPLIHQLSAPTIWGPGFESRPSRSCTFSFIINLNDTCQFKSAQQYFVLKCV